MVRKRRTKRCRRHTKRCLPKKRRRRTRRRRKRGGWGWMFGTVNGRTRCPFGNLSCKKGEVCASSGFGRGRTCHKRNKFGIKGAF